MTPGAWRSALPRRRPRDAKGYREGPTIGGPAPAWMAPPPLANDQHRWRMAADESYRTAVRVGDLRRELAELLPDQAAEDRLVNYLIEELRVSWEDVGRALARSRSTISRSVGRWRGWGNG